MSLEKTTNCPEFTRSFDGFLDGELDPTELRSMSQHVGQCATCGGELERAERLQSLLTTAVEERVAAIDTKALWSAIESRLEAPRPGLWDRLRRILSPDSWLRPVPALMLSGAVAAALAFWLWPSMNQPTSVEVANNHAQIERIESSAPHIAVWSEPERHTTAIWVASYEPEGMP